MAQLLHSILRSCYLVSVFGLFLCGTPVHAQTNSELPAEETSQAQVVEDLEAPLYSPFIERYVLDELKSLRIEMADQKHELMQQILDREHNSVDRAVTYSTDTITYFFYLIAGVSSVLVIMGLSSMRDVQKRIRAVAEERVTKLIDVYETRLENLERVVKQKAQNIKENRGEIERTQELQSLWLRAAQTTSSAQKIATYDEILKCNPKDVEALIYKADAVLELEEPQWAANLCDQALAIDTHNSQAYYQIARAYTAMDMHEEAIQSLRSAIQYTETYRNDLQTDASFVTLAEFPEFQKLYAEHV